MTSGRAIRFLGDNEITPLVTAAEAGGAYCVLELRIQPGGGATALHTDHWVETFHLLEGEVEWTLERDGRLESWLASPGETVVVPRGARHRFAGAGEGPARMLAVGPAEFERFFRALAQAWEGPYDRERTPAAVAPVFAAFGMRLATAPARPVADDTTGETMNEEFWRERWERKEIAFHQREVNGRLQECWDRLGLRSGDPVLVPLCGKSNDLSWLRARGHPVLGVELSPLAVAEFYAEHGLEPHRRREGSFELFEADGIRILCGNVFDLTQEAVAGVKAIYDRAALVALPPGLRDRYAAHLAEVVAPGTPMLLVTLEYPSGEMEGPPFSIPPAEVERLYGDHGRVRPLAREAILSAEPRFAERGVTALDECAYLVTLEA